MPVSYEHEPADASIDMRHPTCPTWCTGLLEQGGDEERGGEERAGERSTFQNLKQRKFM